MEQSFINEKDFFRIVSNLSYFPKCANLAVAVSGGADSLCLSILLNKYCIAKNYNLTALIVDHKLRTESTSEANHVKTMLESFGIRSVILTRNPVALSVKVQETARQDRYKLLTDYCVKNYISHLFVAHHLNDQIETLIMRNQKGKNIVGAAGMSAKVVNKDIIFLRPFLNFTKTQIIDTLKRYTSTWIEDPSNQNVKYKRVEIRQSLLNTDIFPYIKQLQENSKNRVCLEKETLIFLSRNCVINAIGTIEIDFDRLINLNHDLQLYVIRLLLKFISGDKYAVSITSVEKMIDFFVNRLSKQGLNNRYSLGGCILVLKHPKLKIIPEYRAKIFSVELTKEFKTFIHYQGLTIQDSKYFWFLNDKKELENNYFLASARILFANLFVSL